MIKKTKVKQLLWKKLNLIDGNVKDAIIKCYMQRAKIRFHQRFLQWRLDFKFTTVTDEIVSL